MTISGGTAPQPASNEITQAIELFIACGFTPRHILQLARLHVEVHEASYGEVRSIFADKRLVLFKKQLAEKPLK